MIDGVSGFLEAPDDEVGDGVVVFYEEYAHIGCLVAEPVVDYVNKSGMC